MDFIIVFFIKKKESVCFVLKFCFKKLTLDWPLSTLLHLNCLSILINFLTVSNCPFLLKINNLLVIQPSSTNFHLV